MGRYSNNKLGKTDLLMLHNEIRKYIPETRKATDQDVLAMLERYKMVYIKPTAGTGGFGIVKAERKMQGNNRIYQYKYNTRSRQFSTFDGFYRALRKIMGRRKYLVQQGIRMMTYRKRPFDIRVMVQRNEQGDWEHTGTIGRMAHPKRIVTNYHSGGTPLPLRTLLKPHLSSEGIKKQGRMLASLGVKVAAHMQTGFPVVKEIGVDIGLDRKRTPWIFEVNTRPDPFIFLKLGRPAVFRRIIRLTRLHGRFRQRTKKRNPKGSLRLRRASSRPRARR